MIFILLSLFEKGGVNLLCRPAFQPSFPSGHAAFYFAIAAVIFLYLKEKNPQSKFWWGIAGLYFLAAFLISISRVFCGIHWLSDILAGAIVGIFSGWLIYMLIKEKNTFS